MAKRSAFIVRLTLKEHRLIKKAAKRRGMSVTMFARWAMAVLGDVHPVPAPAPTEEQEKVTRAALG